MGLRHAGSPGRTDSPSAYAHAWADASCAAQGVSLKITDGVVLRKVAGLLGVTAGQVGAPSRTATRSDPPDGLVAAGIEAVEAPPSRLDDNVIEDG